MTDSDAKDKTAARATGLALIAVILLALAGIVFMLPALGTFVADNLAPGVDVKAAAIGAFIVTVVLFVVFAVVAGDGLIGELHSMLAGFFAFFLILTLLIAWIF